jgi:predicted phage terminase large subunit-like protein
VVIDDPIRSREDADSELIREKTWDWYKSDLYTRLKPGGRIVLIQTRWHEDDLAGRLLEDMATGGDQWEVISLPAIAEANDPLGRSVGQALWPEWENTDELDRKRRTVGPRDWTALYQQRPAPEDGDYFRAAWLKPYDKVPARETLRIYGGSDYAVTADGGDFTVHAVVGLDPEGRMYLLDLWRKQAASDEWVEAFCDLVKEWKPVGWAEEHGQIKSGVGPYIDRRQRERQAYVYRETFPTRGDKAVRAQSIRGRMALEGLYVPVNADWYPAFRSELLSFPAGKHDDQVDALGLIGQLLDKMMAGNKPAQPEKAKNQSGYRKHSDDERADDWKAY